MQIVAQTRKKRKTVQAKKRLVTANNSDSSDSCSSHPMSFGEEYITFGEEYISDAITSDEVYQDVTPLDNIKERNFVLIRFCGPKRKQYYKGKAVDVFDDGDITFNF